MSRAQLLKSLIKGTDIVEDATLNKYLMSRGINPKYATKDQKVAHSKTGAFNTWKKARMMEDTLDERVDKKDAVTLDIPLLIRVLELAREDIKTDMDLHRVVEKLINIRNKGMLTMKDYNYIAKIHEEVMSQVSSEVIEEAKKDPCWTGYQMVGMKKKGGRPVPNCVPEEVEPIDEISRTTMLSYATKAHAKYDTLRNKKDSESTAKKSKLASGIKKANLRINPQLKDKPKDQQHHIDMSSPKAYYASKSAAGQRYTADSVEHDNATMVEAQSAAVRWQKALETAKKKREEEERRNAENAKRALTPVKEDKFQDSMAATQTVGMEVDNPSDAERKSQRSKSARIIKSIYKRKNMKEDLYDHEKDDKPAATYGKKPKMSVTKPTDNVGENKPDAAAILTGGKTLTGQTRDTIEIDPMMKKRPGSDPTGKNK